MTTTARVRKAMATSATFQRTRSGDEERVVLGNGRAEVSWGMGAELTLFEHGGSRTRIVGGPLVELLDPQRSHRPFVVGMGRDSDADFAADPATIGDALGIGLETRRTFPVAGQTLTAVMGIRVYHEEPWVVVTLRLVNHGPDPLVVNRLFPFVVGQAWGEHPLVLGGNLTDFAVYKQGWQSWSFTGGLPPGAPDPRPKGRTTSLWNNPGGDAPREPLGQVADVVSEGMTIVGRDSDFPALLAGFLGAERHFGEIYVNRAEGSLAAAALVDACTLLPGESVETDPLLLAVGAPNALLETYASALAGSQGARSSASSPTGWCSWYCYYTAVSEADVLENLAALRSVRGALPLDVVQIDDGYQRAVGDWTSLNEKFPSGMGALAQRVRDAGFRPGLWLAPFTVAADSGLAAEHPEWLIHDMSGRPRDVGTNWQVTLHGLDTTHPGAREWLRRLFGTIVEQWGFDYLKLDFLVTAAMAGRRWVASTTRAAALRQGLELIRSVVGNDVYLLGCGCPLLSAVGLVDAMRIGPDVAPHWSLTSLFAPQSGAESYPLPNTEGAIRSTLLRAWMAPALWANDPDCLLAREAESDLTLAEVQAVASAIALTGGVVMLSDRLSRLTLERLDLAARLLPPLQERALPTSYLRAGAPERVLTEIHRAWGSWWVLGVFNSEPTAREIRITWDELGLPPNHYHATEFWSGSYLGVSAEGAGVPVAAHGAAILALRAATVDPLLLSTSFHFSQGGAEIAGWDYDRASGRLLWTAVLGRRAAGTFTLWMPHHLAPRRLVSTARAAQWRRQDGELIVVETEITDRAEFALELEEAR
jgi:alpha-galactosidase